MVKSAGGAARKLTENVSVVPTVSITVSAWLFTVGAGTFTGSDVVMRMVEDVGTGGDAAL